SIPLATELMSDSALPPRQREVVILRTFTFCNEAYDLAHQRAMARQIGMGSDVHLEEAYQNP
ncbi:MAG: carboxymuconolactone decarboxylase family protein, partial [Bacteroidales bacterium]|nr:carboxymuconolactone decarboxylase family protein [Bacteroidales bacterium]